MFSRQNSTQIVKPKGVSNGAVEYYTPGNMPGGAVDYYMHGHQPPLRQPNHHPQGQVQQRILEMQQVLSSRMRAEEKLHRIGDMLGKWMMYESQSQVGGTMY